MAIIFDFLKLIRIKNLFIIVLTQFMIKRILIDPFSSQNALTNFDFYLLVLSTVFIAGAGNIINDYFDLKVDRLNNRKLIVGKTIKRRVAILLHLIFSSIGIFIGFYLSYKVGIFSLGFINLFCVISLWFYSVNFKRKPLSGNLIVALLSALVLLIVPLFDLLPNPDSNTINIIKITSVYSIFAFTVSLIREIVKDLEDIDGDKKANHNTLAVKLGLEKTKKITIVICSALFIMICWILFLQYNSSIYSFIYVLITIAFPIAYLIFKLIKSKTKNDFYYLSQLLKLIMLFGILSMFVFWLILQL
jgi:4-hydroxybenzoate polyprenyltransferase